MVFRTHDTITGAKGRIMKRIAPAGIANAPTQQLGGGHT
jgi:hypothetical protein